ncbi:MAG: hypothetical protein WCK34_17975 [Bacteroidota bacterium]
METTIIIAVITSTASIIMAIISLINNRLNRKNAIITNQALESLKYDIERKRIRFDILDENFKNNFQELGHHISHIQIFKDYLIFIENSTEESLDSETALAGIKKRKDEMFDCFEKMSLNLDKEGLEIAHSAKNLTFQAELKIIQFSKGKQFIQLNDLEKDYINNVKNKLNEYQILLRDLRLNILANISK